MKLLSALALMLAAPAAAAPVTLASPSGTVQLTVDVNGEGRPVYSVARGGVPVIAPSELGFLFTDAPQMLRNFEIVDTTRARVDESWTQPWGEWTAIRNHHHELKVRLRERTPLKREMILTFRAFDDGLGFRYEVPAQPNLQTANIAEEVTHFAFASGGTAWWKPAFLWNREEYLYEKTPLSALGTADTPVTIRLDNGPWVALHEAALIDYSAMAVMKTTGNTLKAVLTPGAGGPKVVRAGGFTTPWRTLIIADDAPGLYMSHLMLNLNEPNRLGDISWFRPGKFAGVWWNMIKGEWTWARGPRHGATNANVMRYIDFAHSVGVPYLLVEGWNVGWDGDWFGNGTDMQFDTPTADFDARMLADYAASRGVALVGHNETGGSASHYEAQLDRAFGFARDHGISVIKTGYVADAGQIMRDDGAGGIIREWHQGQWMARHHVRVLEAAARHRIAIDTHEPIKGTGLHRTWPNWVAREGSRGMEYNAWPGKNPPEHEANLVFTRMLEGPMDFTPGLLGLKGSDGSDIHSTIAKQLALYVVLYSPIQMLADTPEHYARYPEPLRFIRDVPTDWSETRVLNGVPGDYATIVRKERNGEDWYLGAVGDEEARTLTIALDFLSAGKPYEARIYRDGDDADYRTAARHSIQIETRVVGSTGSMVLKLAPGGGMAVRFRALPPAGR